MKRMEVYREWLSIVVMKVGERRTLVITQSEDVKPNYRDKPPP